MSHKPVPRLPRAVSRALPALLATALLSSCALTGVGTMDAGYTEAYATLEGSATDLPPVPNPNQWLLSTLDNSEIPVSHVGPTEVPEAQNVTVTQAYTPDPGTGSILNVSGVLDSGALVGVLSTNPPVPGQVGPILGTLATVQDGTETLIFPDPSDHEPRSIGQVETSRDALAWTQAQPGSEQWEVFYQSPSGVHTKFTASTDTYSLINGSLDLSNNSQGDSILWGARAKDPEDQAQQKFQIHRVGEVPGNLLIAAPKEVEPQLLSSGYYLQETIAGRDQLEFRSPFWMSYEYYPDSFRYRPEDKILAVDTANLVVAIHAANQSGEWIDVFSIDGDQTVNRIALTTEVSSVKACGNKVAWVSTEGDVRTTNVYDTVTQALVYLPAKHNTGEVFCSATSIATTLFDTNNLYVGAEVVTLN